MPDIHTPIEEAVAKLGNGPLTESGLVEHIHPLFSRTLNRNQSTDEIYLANHSLGRPMDAIADRVQAALDAWYDDLDGAWNHWLDERDAFRKNVAKMLNCAQWDAVVPKSSAGQGLRAAINSLPQNKPNIVSTRGEFDSLDFILKSYAHKDRASLTWIDANEDGLYQADEIIDSIKADTDLVVLSLVCFVTGQLLVDMDRVVQAAHERGALVLVDAYHGFGTVPIDFDSLGADFLVAGSYKYTRGGPGACFLVIHPRHLSTTGGVPDKDSLFTTDTGWFAKQDPFEYRRTNEPEYAPSGDAWLEATPPVLVYPQANPGLELVNAIGVDRLRTYSLEQQQCLRDLLQRQGVKIRQLEHHGAFVLMPTESGHEMIRRLKESGVNADARPCPKSGQWLIRLCPDMLNTKAELIEASVRIGSVFKNR